MTKEEKYVAVIVWLATDIFARAPSNTDGYIDIQMKARYPELAHDNYWLTDLHDILDQLVKEGNVKFQIRDTKVSWSEGLQKLKWYEATLKGKEFAKNLLDKRDVLKYIRRSGVVKNKLSPLQMADKVLQWFCMDINEVLDEEFADNRDRKSRLFVTQQDAGVAIIDHFIKDGFKELNSTEFTWYFPLIMDKLVKDGLTTYNEQSKHYSQNMEGIIFSKDGGYIGREFRQNSEVRRARQIHNLTWILAVGVTAPFVKDLFEVSRMYYYPTLKPFVYFFVPIFFFGFLGYFLYTFFIRKK